MSTQHDPGSQRKPSGVDQHHKHLVLKLHLYQRKCHNHRRQTTLAIIAIKTIELVSQPNWLAETSMFIHPSREVRYDCSKPKGNTCIQVVFTQSPVSLTTTSEYLPVSGTLDPLCICTRFHTQLHQSKERKSHLTCLRLHNCSDSGQRKPWKQTHNKVSCFVSKYSSKQFPLPTQFRSFPMTHRMSQSNALTTAVQT